MNYLNGFIVLCLLLGPAGIMACGNGASSSPVNDSRVPSETPVKEEAVITVGNLTDQTGVAAKPMSYIEMALDDMVDYYNEADIIPGVKLKVIDYDEKYEPAKDIPGYEKLRAEGADFIWTPVPAAVPVLKPRVDKDRFVLFAATANMAKEDLNGGYVFSLGITPKNEALTLMDWLVRNDADFPQDRPARIGGAAWNDGYSNILYSAAESYAKAHPDQYRWEGTYLTDFGFDWTFQAEQLKQCDYVFVPTPPQTFMRDFRDAGGTAKFLGSDVHIAFMQFFGKANLWNEIDGALFIRSSRWYNETGEIIDLTTRLLEQNYSVSEQAEIRAQGCGYISTKHHYLMLDIVRETVEAVRAQNFTPETLYDAATNWSFKYEGIPDFDSFTETKRVAQNYYAVYEARAEAEDIFRVHPEWLPQVTSPE